MNMEHFSRERKEVELVAQPPSELPFNDSLEEINATLSLAAQAVLAASADSILAHEQ